MEYGSHNPQKGKGGMDVCCTAQYKKSPTAGLRCDSPHFCPLCIQPQLGG